MNCRLTKTQIASLGLRIGMVSVIYPIAVVGMAGVIGYHVFFKQ